jgi:hypothetical protein
MVTKDLETKVAELEVRSRILDDIIGIINLQSKFNYYLELNYNDKIVDELFAQKDPDVKCEVGDSGVYIGIESIRRFWKARQVLQPVKFGYMACVMNTTPIVQVSKDGKTGKGIWWGWGPQTVFSQGPVVHEEPTRRAVWYSGKYENEFVKEDGKWKFHSLHALVYMMTPFEEGYLKAPEIYKFAPPASACKPDKLGCHNPYNPNGKVPFLPLASGKLGLTLD